MAVEVGIMSPLLPYTKHPLSGPGVTPILKTGSVEIHSCSHTGFGGLYGTRVAVGVLIGVAVTVGTDVPVIVAVLVGVGVGVGTHAKAPPVIVTITNSAINPNSSFFISLSFLISYLEARIAKTNQICQLETFFFSASGCSSRRRLFCT